MESRRLTYADLRNGKPVISDSDEEEEKQDEEDHRLQAQASGLDNLPGTVKPRPARFKLQYQRCQRKPTRAIDSPNPDEEDIEVVDLTTDGDEYVPTPQRFRFRPRPIISSTVLNGKPKQYSQLRSTLQREPQPIKVTEITLNGKPMKILAYTRNPLDAEVEDQGGRSTGSDSDLSLTNNSTRHPTNKAQAVGIRTHGDDVTQNGGASTEELSRSTSPTSGDEHTRTCLVENDSHNNTNCIRQQCATKETEHSDCRHNDVNLQAITSVNEVSSNDIFAYTEVLSETIATTDGVGEENSAFISDLIKDAEPEKGSEESIARRHNGRGDEVAVVENDEFEDTKAFVEQPATSASANQGTVAETCDWRSTSNTSLCTAASNQDVSHRRGIYQLEVQEIEHCGGGDDGGNSTASDMDSDSESDIGFDSCDKNDTLCRVKISTTEVTEAHSQKDEETGEQILVLEGRTEKYGNVGIQETDEVGGSFWSVGKKKGFNSFLLEIAPRELTTASPEGKLDLGRQGWRRTDAASSTDEDERRNRSIEEVVENMLLSDRDTFLEPEPTTISLSQPIHRRKRPKTKKRRNKQRSKRKAELSILTSSDTETDSGSDIRKKSKRKRRRKEDRSSCSKAAPAEPKVFRDPEAIKIFQPVIRIRRIDDVSEAGGYGGTLKLPSSEAQQSALNGMSEPESGIELKHPVRVTRNRTVNVSETIATSPTKTRYGRMIKQPKLLPDCVVNNFGSDESS